MIFKLRKNAKIASVNSSSASLSPFLTSKVIERGRIVLREEGQKSKAKTTKLTCVSGKGIGMAIANRKGNEGGSDGTHARQVQFGTKGDSRVLI